MCELPDNVNANESLISKSLQNETANESLILSSKQSKKKNQNELVTNNTSQAFQYPSFVQMSGATIENYVTIIM